MTRLSLDEFLAAPPARPKRMSLDDFLSQPGPLDEPGAQLAQGIGGAIGSVMAAGNILGDAIPQMAVEGVSELIDFDPPTNADFGQASSVLDAFDFQPVGADHYTFGRQDAYRNKLPYQLPEDISPAAFGRYEYPDAPPEQHERYMELNELATGQPRLDLASEVEKAARQYDKEPTRENRDSLQSALAAWGGRKREIDLLREQMGDRQPHEFLLERDASYQENANLAERMAQSAWEGLSTGAQQFGAAMRDNTVRTEQIGREAAWRESMDELLDKGSSVAKYSRQAAGALGQMAPALAAGFLTKNPVITYTMMTGQAGVNAYGQARSAGWDHEAAAGYGATMGAIEGLTEVLGGRVAKMAGLETAEEAVAGALKRVAGEFWKSPVKNSLKGLFKAAGGSLIEGGEEGLAELLGSLTDVFTDMDPEALSDWRRFRDATIIGTLIGVAGHTPKMLAFLDMPTKDTAEDAGLPDDLSQEELEGIAEQASEGIAAKAAEQAQTPPADPVAPPAVPAEELSSFPPQQGAGVAEPSAATPEIVPEQEQIAPEVAVAPPVEPVPQPVAPEQVQPQKKRLGRKKPPKAEPTNTIAGKMTLQEFEDKGYQPDEVTQADWVNMQRAFRRSIGQAEESGTPYAPFADYEEYHKQAVREAIARGEEVDDRVLADYPDLAPQPQGVPNEVQTEGREEGRQGEVADPYAGRKTKPGDLYPSDAKSWISGTVVRAPNDIIAQGPQAVADHIRNTYEDKYYWKHLQQTGKTLEQAVQDVMRPATTQQAPVVEPPAAEPAPKKRLGRKRPVLTAQDFRQQLQSAATNQEEADALYSLVEARAEAAGESVDDYVGKRIAGVERGPQSGSVAIKQGALEPGKLPRGEAQFLNDGRAVIRAFEEAQDASTLAHEVGHVFRRDLTDADLKAAEEWAEVKDGKWNRPQEEKFARGFERYLRDGTAPTPKLADVFAKFKKWLSAVYKKLKGSPIDVKITPEMKAVYDSLFTPKRLGRKPAAVEVVAESPDARKERSIGLIKSGIFFEGQRVEFVDRDGSTKTGTVRGGIGVIPGRVDITVDQSTKAGGVPIGRIAHILAVDITPLETKATAAEPTTEKPPKVRLAEALSQRLKDGASITREEFFELADREFGGSRAEGKYGDSEAYDALELAVNSYIVGNFDPTVDADDAKSQIAELEKLTSKLPQHKARTGEKDTLQQFSTPPAYAYLTAWAANIRGNDVVLEPSVGTGGIASHAINATENVYGNEIDQKRAELARQLPLKQVFTEDAERIAGILKGKMPLPTVVLMNPPFSRAGKRLGNKKVPGTDRKHIDEALRLMPSDGRLVAIIGAGLHGRGKAFDNWLADLPYSVKADIEVGRDVYKGYGTTFPTRLLVIDKTPRSGGSVTAQAATLAEAVDLLEGVRNERQSARPTEPQSTQATESGRRPAVPVQPPARAVDVEGTAAPSTRPSGEVRTRTTQRGVQDVGVEREGDPANNRRERGQSSQPTTEQPAVDAGRDARGKPARESTAASPVTEDAGNKLDVEVRKPTRKKELTDSTFEPYEPTVRVKGSKKHPASLVESAAMAAIPSPAVTYKPNIDQKVIEGYKTPDGVQVGISDVQLEAVAQAGAAHAENLPSGERRGFMIGDGTGVGKAREISGIILDNWNQGRTKAVWVSKNDKLFEPARDEWSKVGGTLEDVFNHAKIASGSPIGADKGILFTTYSTLWRSASDQAAAAGNAKSRLDQIVDWLGEDFDGVVIFDEAHEMGSAIDRGQGLNKKKASNKAVAGLDLQDRLPNARVVYLSATSATEVANLAYASRLGLWGDGTPFATREQFVDRITAGGVAAMEKVAADMKALGMYLARNIAFNDGTDKGTVTYERLEHTLTNDQDRAYGKMADAWQTVFRNMAEALELTGAKQNGVAVGRARSNFWSANQRFWNQVITAMQTPTAIKQIERSLAAGHSAVVQLTNTNEAAQKRALAGRAKDEDVDDVDVSPKYILIDYVSRSFPTAAYEEFIDENGNTRTRPVTDSEGNVVHDPSAEAMKERLLDELSSLQVANRGALDMIIDHFGEDNVAEVTGRSERLVLRDGKLDRQKRSSRSGKADIAAFMDGKKRILIFSEAGGTGASYHADLTRKNQQKRDHILLQPGWRADAAVQGLGRSHRSNQAQAPTYFLIHTNLKGQKRFISTIARRLAQLGALTKGQRQAGEAGVFSAADNLESTEAHEALHDLYQDIQANRVESLSPAYLADALGLEIVDDRGNLKTDLPPITQFMNRVLSLPPTQQNAVFDEFDRRLQANVEAAMAAGTLDQGMETVKADRITKVSDEVVYRHPSGAETRHVVVRVGRRTKPTDWDTVQTRLANVKLLGYVKSEKTGKAWAVEDTGITAQTKQGNLTRKLKLHGPMGVQYNLESVMASSGNWTQMKEPDAKVNWDDQVANAPEMHEEDMHILDGVLLPIWDRMPESNTQVKRLLTDDGEQILGRVIPSDKIRDVLKKLGVSTKAPKMSPQEAAEVVQDGKVLVLANDWRIKRSKVEGEWTTELVGPDYSHHDELDRLGVNRRRIGGYSLRYFIPVGDQAAEVIEKIIANRPIVDVLGGRSGDSVQGAAPGPALQPLASNPALTPKSQRQIIADLAKGLDTPIRFGRLTTRKWSGYFQAIANLIGSKRANDIPLISHEAGHRIDSLFKLSDNKAIAAELEMLGEPSTPNSRSSWTKSKTKAYKRGEGVAEFMRYWLTDPTEAQKLSPNTFLAFEQILDANRDLARVLRQAQEDIRVWRTSEPQARLRSHISRGENPLKSRYGLQEATRDTVDDLHYLRLASEDAIKGQPGLSPSRNPYLLARNLRGSYGMAETFINKGQVNFKTKEVKLGTSLEDILKPVAGRMRDFGDWIVAKRAQELHKQGRETGLVDSDVQEVAALYDNDRVFQQAFADIKAWNDSVLQYAVDAGLVTKDAASAMRQMNQDYVPFHRLFEVGADEASSTATTATGSGLNPGKPGSLKRLKGSTRNIVDPIETMIKNSYAIVTAAEKAAISNAVADMARLPNMGKWVEKVASPSTAVRVPLARIRQQLEDAGADLDNVQDDLLMQFFQKSTSPVWGENTIRVVRPNGDVEFYRLNRHLHDTFLALDLEDSGLLIRILSAPAQVLRAGVVLEPGFNLANVLRDTFGAAVLSKYGLLPFEATLRGVSAIIRKPQLVAEWAASGGRSSIEMNYFDRKKMQQYLARRVSKDLTAAERAMIWVKSPLTLLRVLATTAEEATRIGEYEKAYKALRKGGMPEGDARRLAAFEARDRQDFAKGGAKTKILRHMAAFWNAQLQANVRLAQEFKRRPAQTLLKGLAFVTIPKLLEQALNWDDDDYWDRPQWERDLFFLIPAGKDEAGHTEFFRIPVPFEIGVLFATIPGRMLQWQKEQDPKSVQELPAMLLEQTVPNPAPQTVQLIYELYTGDQGWSFFRDRPIVPDRFSDYPPEYQWDEHTSWLAKKAGETLGVSPMKVDYAIESTTGGLGKVFAGKKTPEDRFFTTPLAVSAQTIHDFYSIRKQLTQDRRKEKLTGESDGLGPVMLRRFEKDADRISAIRQKAQDADEQQAAKLQDEAYQIAKSAVEEYRRDPQGDSYAKDYAAQYAKVGVLNSGYPRKKVGETIPAYNARVQEWKETQQAPALQWLRSHKSSPIVQSVVKEVAKDIPPRPAFKPDSKGVDANYSSQLKRWNEKYGESAKILAELTGK